MKIWLNPLQIMKGFSIVVALLSTQHTVVSTRASFGPQNCVSLTRSSGGSCVIATDCEGADLSHTEFAFDCAGDEGEVVRHSYGFGGFDANEEFDTGVKCGECTSTSAEVTGQPAKKKVKQVEPAKPQDVSKPPSKQDTPVAEESQEGVVAMKVQKRQIPEVPLAPMPGAVSYGPSNCVSVYKSSEGHCVMQTQCDGINIDSYDFGLVCVDDKGFPVKHLFGKGSFDSKETFDTLVKCEKCLGLDELPDQVHLAGEVATMEKDVASITAVMKNISANVKMLNEAVMPSAPAPAPVMSSPAPAKEDGGKKAKEAKFLLRHRHQQYREDSDDEYDSRDDRDDEDEEEEHDEYDS
jgi:hypothetical protein